MLFNFALAIGSGRKWLPHEGIYFQKRRDLPDLFYILQLKNKGVVFSNETALYLHGLMEHEPTKTIVSVKGGYNATHLIKRGIKPYFIKKDKFNEGVTIVKTPFGNDVRVYDIDRTICDIVLRKAKMDIQVFQTALKENTRVTVPVQFEDIQP